MKGQDILELMSSSELFESKKDEFQAACDAISKHINSIPSAKGEQRKAIIRETDRHVEMASILLREMEDEMKKAPPSYRMQLATQVRNQKRELEDLKLKCSQVTTMTDFTSPPMGLFSTVNETQTLESANRARLMQGTEALNRTSDSLARSHVLSAETDQIGEGILTDLGAQHESLLRTQNRLTDTDSALVQSRKVLRSMALHAITNKIILIFIIFLELIILGIVLYFKLKK